MSEKVDRYQKKTIEAAINTIMTKMNDINGASQNQKETDRRRWIWELIQNSNDCAGENKVSIWIESNKDQLIFSHNGEAFTGDTLLDLITQISSKRIQKGDKVGKFGTGFISTHLISKVVLLQGRYHTTEESNEYKKMTITLDRSGKDEYEIKDSLENSIKQLDALENSANIDPSEFQSYTTSFIYNIGENADSENAVKIGLEDLEKCIAFVFAFTSKIEKICCNNIIYSCVSRKNLAPGLTMINVEIKKGKNDEKSEIKRVIICEKENDCVSVAIQINQSKDEIEIQNSTKLYCRFPLIGTETFPFPIAINSPDFEVSRERDAIQENLVNKEIIRTATDLYVQLMQYVNQQNYGNIFNLCSMQKPIKYQNKIELSWQEQVYNKIEKIYLTESIVRCTNGDGKLQIHSLGAFENGKFIPHILVPISEKEEHMDAFWELVNGLNRQKPIPIKNSCKFWDNISGSNRINLRTIYTLLLKDSNFENFVKYFDSSNDMILWLNEFYILSFKCNVSIEFLPNQKGEFKKVSELKRDDGIYEELKEVLTLLGTDIKGTLMHKEITLNIDDMKLIDNQQISDKICEKSIIKGNC